MAVKHETNRNDVKVYNLHGTNIATIKTAGTLVIVSGAAVDIASRGSCYPISMPNNGFVFVGYIKTTQIPGEPPPPPDSGSEFPVELRGFDAQGNEVAGAVWKLQ